MEEILKEKRERETNMSKETYTEIQVTIYADNSILLKDNYCNDAKTENIRDSIGSVDDFILHGTIRPDNFIQSDEVWPSIISTTSKSIENEYCDSLTNLRNKNRKFERLSKEHERNIFPLLHEKKEENKTIANVSIKIEPIDESYECTSSSIGQINSNLNGVFTNSRDSILPQHITDTPKLSEFYQDYTDKHHLAQHQHRSDMSIPDVDYTENKDVTSHYEVSTSGLSCDDDLTEEAIDPLRYKQHFKHHEQHKIPENLPDKIVPGIGNIQRREHNVKIKVSKDRGKCLMILHVLEQWLSVLPVYYMTVFNKGCDDLLALTWI